MNFVSFLNKNKVRKKTRKEVEEKPVSLILNYYYQLTTL